MSGQRNGTHEAANATYLCVKDWERFQHYKDRLPPWIKFYYALLTDHVFLALPTATQRDLMMIWLLATRLDGVVPNDERYIRNAIQARQKVDLPAMIAAGFLVPVDQPARKAASEPLAHTSAGREQDASSTLAARKQDAGSTPAHPRTRGETEAETETETDYPPYIPPLQGGSAPEGVRRRKRTPNGRRDRATERLMERRARLESIDFNASRTPFDP